MIEKLSHYTNFDTLDCILNNKSLRYSRLDSLNDLYEQQISNIDYFRKVELFSTFVSCFSTDEENIPLWCLYARSRKIGLTLSEAIKHGVQIKFNKERLKKRVDES